MGRSANTLQPVSELIVGPPLEEALNNIRSDGWCPGFFLNGEVVQELLNYMDNQRYTCRVLPSEMKLRLNQREYLDNKYGTSICFAQCADPDGSQLVQSIAKDQILRNLATRYFGYPPMKVEVKLSVSFATNTPMAERLAQGRAGLFHYDVDHFFHTLFFIFYLTPVDEESGAHVLVPGSHGAKRRDHASAR